MSSLKSNATLVSYVSKLSRLLYFAAISQCNNLYIWSIATLGIGYFVGISRDECPCTDDAQSGCDLPECSYSLSNNDLCEAERALPDGNDNYDINNCPGDYDVFRYVSGNSSFKTQYRSEIFKKNRFLNQNKTHSNLWYIQI